MYLRNAFAGPTTYAHAIGSFAPLLEHPFIFGHRQFLRAGFATSAARAGKPDRDIMRQTGHRSRYVREAEVWRDNAAVAGADPVPDVERALAAIVEAGGSALGEVVNVEVPGAGALRVVYARDPEGNVLELQRWERGRA